MCYFNYNKFLLGLGLISLLLQPFNLFAYSYQDAAALHTQTPVVDGSMPPDILAIQKRGVLREAIFATPIPPFSIQDSEGNWSGLNITFGQELADSLGVKLQIIPAKTYDELVDLIANNDADIALGLSILPVRQLKISFSDSYYTYHPHILVNRLQALKNGWKTPAQVIQALETSSKPLKVGVFAGNMAAQIVQQSFPNIQVIPYQNYEQSFLDVSSGKLFAAIGATGILIQDFLKRNPQATLHVEDVEFTERQDMLGVAVPWSYFHLRLWLNVYIDYLGHDRVVQEFGQ